KSEDRACTDGFALRPHCPSPLPRCQSYRSGVAGCPVPDEQSRVNDARLAAKRVQRKFLIFAGKRNKSIDIGHLSATFIRNKGETLAGGQGQWWTMKIQP